MSIEQVRQHLAQWDRAGDILEFDASTATVELAARAVGVIPARIAKSISLRMGEGAMVLVTAGDARIDNQKYKARFGAKAKMLSPEEALLYTGHAVGGVCPFALPPGVAVYLDQSLCRFDTVFPACGTAHSAIELNLEELALYSGSSGWVDVCKGGGAP